MLGMFLSRISISPKIKLFCNSRLTYYLYRGFANSSVSYATNHTLIFEMPDSVTINLKIVLEFFFFFSVELMYPLPTCKTIGKARGC